MKEQLTLKRSIPIIVVGFILVGTCWWCSAASNLAGQGDSSISNDLETATAEANKPWGYYTDRDTGVTLILPSSWFGSFVDSSYSDAELLTIQRVLPNFGSMLEEASLLGDERPLFIATGRILSNQSTFQPVELFIYRIDKSSLSPNRIQDLKESYENSRRVFLAQYSDEITSDVIETVSSKIYEFSFCSTAKPDVSVCITEYHMLSDEAICQLVFSTTPSQGISAQEEFRSIAKQVRCK